MAERGHHAPRKDLFTYKRLTMPDRLDHGTDLDGAAVDYSSASALGRDDIRPALGRAHNSMSIGSIVHADLVPKVELRGDDGNPRYGADAAHDSTRIPSNYPDRGFPSRDHSAMDNCLPSLHPWRSTIARGRPPSPSADSNPSRRSRWWAQEAAAESSKSAADRARSDILWHSELARRRQPGHQDLDGPVAEKAMQVTHGGARSADGIHHADDALAEAYNQGYRAAVRDMNLRYSQAGYPDGDGDDGHIFDSPDIRHGHPPHDSSHSVSPHPRHVAAASHKDSAKYHDTFHPRHPFPSDGPARLRHAHSDRPHTSTAASFPFYSPPADGTRPVARQQISCYPCRQRRNRCDGVRPCGPCVKRDMAADCEVARYVHRRGKASKETDSGTPDAAPS